MSSVELLPEEWNYLAMFHEERVSRYEESGPVPMPLRCEACGQLNALHCWHCCEFCLIEDCGCEWGELEVS